MIIALTVGLYVIPEAVTGAVLPEIEPGFYYLFPGILASGPTKCSLHAIFRAPASALWPPSTVSGWVL